MEIDGGRDREIKRNMPLGVTQEGVRVRRMRGLQAWEPYMGKNNSSTSFSISRSLSPSLQASPCGRGDQFSSSLPTPPGVCWCCFWVCVCMCFCVCILFIYFTVGSWMRILRSILHPREVQNPLTSSLFSNLFFPFFALFFPFSAFCMASILHPQSLFHSFPLCPPPLSVSAFFPLSLCSSLSGGSVSNGISSADQPEASSQAKCRSCC